MTAGQARRASIREVSSTDDLATLIAIIGAVTPDDPTSLEELRWSDSTYPGTTRFLATAGGLAVGAATVGRIYVHPPDYPDLWATIHVLGEERRRGVGGTLLAVISERAEAAGKTGLQVRVSEDRSESIAFFAHRGFTELERGKVVGLDLADLPAPTVEPPAGVDVVSLAERPDLLPAVHAVAVESFADIPGGDEPMYTGDLDEFQARDVDRPGMPRDGFFVALDAASGDVVGYASLMLRPGSSSVAWHDMTAVRRAWRGRGIARALKRATIAWAIEHGLTTLETGNDEANGAMRAVNAALGYRPRPDAVIMRGPLVSGGAGGRTAPRARRCAPADR